MTQWRILAAQHLPDLAKVIRAAESHFDLWQSLKEILSAAGSSDAKKAEVESIYRYAWWCLMKSGDDCLAAEAGAYFYEDLPAYSDFEDQMVSHITPAQFERLDSLLRYRLTEEEFQRLKLRFRRKET